MTSPTGYIAVDRTYIQGIIKTLSDLITEIELLARGGPGGVRSAYLNNLLTTLGSDSFTPGAAISAKVKETGGSIDKKLKEYKVLLMDFRSGLQQFLATFDDVESLNTVKAEDLRRFLPAALATAPSTDINTLLSSLGNR